MWGVGRKQLEQKRFPLSSQDSQPLGERLGQADSCKLSLESHRRGTLGKRGEVGAVTVFLGPRGRTGGSRDYIKFHFSPTMLFVAMFDLENCFL